MKKRKDQMSGHQKTPARMKPSQPFPSGMYFGPIVTLVRPDAHIRDCTHPEVDNVRKKEEINKSLLWHRLHLLFHPAIEKKAGPNIWCPRDLIKPQMKANPDGLEILYGVSVVKNEETSEQTRYHDLIVSNPVGIIMTDY
ncbi:hypothetical protein RUM44_012766 [Polyplax serrata]|uniref:Uncharacterized protein n=1 Tax=Polyplax serrata TaxID=468196 RepID=A0ABR1BGH0_POLSC